MKARVSNSAYYYISSVCSIRAAQGSETFKAEYFFLPRNKYNHAAASQPDLTCSTCFLRNMGAGKFANCCVIIALCLWAYVAETL